MISEWPVTGWAHALPPICGGAIDHAISGDVVNCPVCGAKGFSLADDFDVSGASTCTDCGELINHIETVSFVHQVNSDDARKKINAYLKYKHIDQAPLSSEGKRIAKREVERLKEEAARAKVLVKLKSLLPKCIPSNENTPYLKKKRLESHSGLYEVNAKAVKDTLGYSPSITGDKGREYLTGKLLVIPIRDINGALMSAEFIDHKGRKSAVAGLQRSGGFFATGDIFNAKKIDLHEGVADTLTGLNADDDCVHVAAFSNNGVKKVAELLVDKTPNADIRICADVNRWRPDGATAGAANKHSLELVAPLSVDGKKIDFDDVRRIYGNESVRAQLSLANIPCFNNEAHEVDGKFYMSGFTWVYVNIDGKGKKWITLFEAMRRHENDFFTCPVTGETASMHPNGFFSLGLKEVVNALPVAPSAVAGFVESVNTFKGLKNTKRRISKLKKDFNIDDLMALIFLVKYRIDADIFIKEHSDKTCVTIGADRFTIPPNTIFYYWIHCISNVRHRVGSDGGGAISKDFKQIEIKRGEDSFPIWTPEILGAMSKANVVVFNMPHGTGKTSKGMPAFLEGSKQSALICHRTALVGQLAEEIKASHYKDDWRFIASGGAQCLASCIDSLAKPRNISHAKQSTHIVIDEFTQVLKHVSGGGAKRSDAGKEENSKVMYGTLREALPGKRILLMDADTNNHSIDTLLELSGYTRGDVVVINCPDVDLSYVADVRCTALNDGGKTTIAEARKALDAGERIVIACESELHARKINGALSDYKTKLIHGKIDDREKAEFTDSPVNQSAKYQCVIYTSVLGTGFSVKHERLSEQFSKCFYIGFGAIQSSQDAIQMVRRFRDVRQFHFQVLLRPDLMTHRHYRRLEKSGDPLERLQHHYTYNHGLNVTHFASELVLALKGRKFTVNRPDLVDESLLDDIKIISTDELREIDENTLVNAKGLSVIEFESLSKKTFKTNEERAQIDRYQCVEFYGSIDQAGRYVSPKEHHQDRRLLRLMDADNDSLLGRYRSLLNNPVIKKGDASKIITFVTENIEDLINAEVLPAKWSCWAKVPGERVVQSVKTALAEFGIKGETCGDRRNPSLKVTLENFHVDLLRANKVDYKPVKTREQAVMRMKAKGMTYEQIAKTIGVSRRTVANIVKISNQSAKTAT